MSDMNSNETEVANSPTAQTNPFSRQATGLLETTFAETLGLSMHNAVTNQQSSQMTTSASITNACARLLQAPGIIRSATEKSKDNAEPAAESAPTEKTEKKGLFSNLSNLFKRDKKKSEASSGEK